MLNTEDKRNVAQRLYDITTLPKWRVTRDYCRESFLDGLWFGLMRGGMTMDEYSKLEDEINAIEAGFDEDDTPEKLVHDLLDELGSLLAELQADEECMDGLLERAAALGVKHPWINQRKEAWE